LDKLLWLHHRDKTIWTSFPEKEKGLQNSPKPAMPWLGFDVDVKAKLDQIFVLKHPVGKYRGTGHAETVLSVRNIDGKTKAVKRIPLTTLTMGNLEKMVDKDTTNKLLYAALRNQLLRFPTKAKETKKKPKEEYDAAKAFAGDFIFNGLVVRKVRCYVDRGRGILVRNGLAHNKDNVRRVDLFRYQEKLRMRIVYTYNIAKKQLSIARFSVDPIGTLHHPILSVTSTITLRDTNVGIYTY